MNLSQRASGRLRSTLSRFSAALLAAAALSLAAREASADEGSAEQAHNFIAVGALAGFTGHLDTPVLGALGLEIAYTNYPLKPLTLGVGAFGQVQSVGLQHLRAAMGAQFNFTVGGLELGASVEQGKDGKATTFGVHLAPFVSVGVVSVAFRMGLPFAALIDGADKYAVDLGLIATAKIPIALGGSYF